MTPISDLTGQVVVVTGASSGIGEATARLFAQHGARVALVARRADLLEQLASEISGFAVPADVSDPQAVEGAFRRIDAELGEVKVLVNGAGVCKPAPLKDTTVDVWRRDIDVNLSSAFYCSREAGLRMLESGGGNIVNLGSELSVMGMVGYSAYCAAKAGIIGLTKALAVELAPTIRVNAICPGPVDTPMLRGEFEILGNPEEIEQESIKRVPLGRFASPEEVAEGIWYLAAHAGFATGATLELDGGTTIV